MTTIKVTLPKGAHVVLLEDSDMRINWFEHRIANLVVCKSVQEFKEHFDTKPQVDFIFFDHDLGEGGTGLDAAKWLVDKFGGSSRWGLIHSWNLNGAANMRAILRSVPHVPFGDFDIVFED
jgi:hypothetical protein